MKSRDRHRVNILPGIELQVLMIGNTILGVEQALAGMI